MSDFESSTGGTQINYLSFPTTSLYNTELSFVTPAVQGNVSMKLAPEGQEKGKISLSLYFKFVKSRMTKLQQANLQKMVARYNALRFDAEQLGQRGLYEQLSESLLLAVRELQLLACGVNTVIQKADVERFMGRAQGKILLCPLREFPRVIPPQVKRRLKSVQDRELFDNYYVLFHPAAEERLAKPNAERIKEKDPILFGTFKHAPQRLYFIADWIDEHCDLTLEKLVGELKTFDKEYEPVKLRAPSESDIEKLKRDVLERAARLQDTRMTNFREQEQQAREAEKKAKLPWYRRAWRYIIEDLAGGRRIRT